MRELEFGLWVEGISLVVQIVKHPLAMRETQVWSLSREDPLEKEIATHSSIFTWRIHGQKSLVGYSPWACKDLDTTKWLSTHTSAGRTTHYEKKTIFMLNNYGEISQTETWSIKRPVFPDRCCPGEWTHKGTQFMMPPLHENSQLAATNSRLGEVLQ